MDHTLVITGLLSTCFASWLHGLLTTHRINVQSFVDKYNWWEVSIRYISFIIVHLMTWCTLLNSLPPDHALFTTWVPFFEAILCTGVLVMNLSFCHFTLKGWVSSIGEKKGVTYHGRMLGSRERRRWGLFE